VSRTVELVRESTGMSKSSATASQLALGRRATTINQLKSSHIKTHQYDVLVIGGGATGAGAALDAATRGLRVACVEKEDFASGTSSRSTKLIWGGSRYLVQALVNLFSFKTFKHPIKSVSDFTADFKMVLNCHRERKFLLDTQQHLTNWVCFPHHIY
jgi:glycerol-3-phosphate dehydrogenase